MPNAVAVSNILRGSDRERHVVCNDMDRQSYAIRSEGPHVKIVHITDAGNSLRNHVFHHK